LAGRIARTGIASRRSGAVPLGAFSLYAGVILVAYDRVYELLLRITDPVFAEYAVLGSLGVVRIIG
jgi:hypothetical protein